MFPALQAELICRPLCLENLTEAGMYSCCPTMDLISVMTEA